MSSKKQAVATLASLLRASDDPCPVLLLGAGASFRSGVPTAAEAVKQIARLVYSERVLAGSRPPERVKPSEWEPWLQSFSWFIRGADRLAENFPIIVEQLLTPAEFRKRVMLELMARNSELSAGYKFLAEFVMRGLVRSILTTNFDTCLLDALRERQPHIRQIQEVNRGPGDYAQFNVFNKCQIVWLHGRAEQYSDKNSLGEVGVINGELTTLLRPLLAGSPIVVVGYRGAEPSIMEGLFGQNGQGRLDFPHGLYWCLRNGETPHPNVLGLGRRLGSNFRLLNIEGFDELFADLSRELAGQDRYQGTVPGTATPPESRAFDERVVPSATLDDLDLDLALSVLREYCEKLGRAMVTRETLLVLMREQGLLLQDGQLDRVTGGAILLFGKHPENFFPHAVVSITEAGKKREIYEGNLIGQHRKLLAKLEMAEVNPRLKVKKRRQHDEQPAYPPRALVELLVNMLVHRDYEVPEPSRIEIFPGEAIVFTNPGGLTQKLVRHVTIENDGRFTLPESLTDQRNPSLCDIFFGMSAMERAGTGIIDVGDLMLACGGASAFYHHPKESRFEARITQPQASAGSRIVARSTVPTGIYVLNALPFTLLPEKVTVLRLTVPFRERPRTLDLSRCGVFVHRGSEIWSFVPLPILTERFGAIVDTKASESLLRNKVEESVDSKRVLSWLLRKHFERYLAGFVDDGLILEDGRKHRAYFEGRNGQGRAIVWDGPRRARNRREVVKKRGEGVPWFENEGFGYEVVDICGTWCVRVKPFYMFTRQDARTPLSSVTRAAKATRRMKFDRNKSVEADLAFWSCFLGKGAETINVGQEYATDVLIEASFLTIEVPEIGLISDESEDKNRMPA
jgi:hypothetical protein